jgi:Tol biopolymer transport system component
LALTPEIAIAQPAWTLKRLTANPAEDPILHAALAPDGRALAYVDKSGAHIQRIGEPAGPAIRIALPEKSDAELVAWAPSSDWLVVSASRASEKEGANETSKELWRASLDGAATRLTPHGNFTGISVSPDGARLAYAEEDRVAWTMLDGSRAPVPLVDKEAGCFITELAWSPDGGRIAYANLCFRSLGEAAIESVDVAGGPPTIALADPRLAQESGVGGLAWGSDGRLIYSLAEWFPAENGSNLWSLDVDPKTGRPRGASQKLTSWSGTLASVISADHEAQRIAFLRFDFQADVYVGDIAADGRKLLHPQRLTRTDRNERPAAWDPESRGVYFITDRRGLYDVFYQARGDMDARAVIADFGSETGAQVVRGGAELLYWQLPKIESPQTVHPRLMRAPAFGGPATLVWTATSTSYPEGAGRPQPWEMRFRCARAPGAACVVSEKEGDTLVFRALDPELGAGAELRTIAKPTAASFFWDLSPDGKRIAMPTENGPVKIETLRGDVVAERRVPDGCDPIYVTWAADNAALFVSAECSNAPVFRLYSVTADGSAHVLWDDSPDWLLNTEASPDGKRLAIAVKHADNDVWLLEQAPAR